VGQREKMAADNMKGLILAVGSSLFIGTSFILKKKGLRRAAAKGTRAGLPASLISPLLAELPISDFGLYACNLLCFLLGLISCFHCRDHLIHLCLLKICILVWYLWSCARWNVDKYQNPTFPTAKDEGCFF